MNQAKISVIIPIYNVEKYLYKSIESVINQTYKNLEIILIDDGSIDNSSQICDEWKKKDNRIKVIHKENGGVSSARNLGLEKATGSYIAFLDPDDYIEATMYEKLYNSILKNNSNLAMCGFKFVYENNHNEKIVNEINLPKIVENNIYPYLLNIGYIEKENQLHTQNIMGCVWRALFSKELLNNLYFEKLAVCEDLAFIIDVFDRKPKVSIVNEPLYSYLQRNNSYVHSYNEQKIKQRINAYKTIIPKIENKVNTDNINAYKFHIYASIINELLKNGHRKQVKQIVEDEYLKNFNTKQNYTLAKKFTISFKHKIAYFFIYKKMFWLYSVLLKLI